MSKIVVKPKNKITIKCKPAEDLEIEQSSSDTITAGDTAVNLIYKKLKLVEQILKRPNTYIGSTQLTECDMFVYDDEMKQMIKKKTRFVPGLYKIYDECVVNMIDHNIRMRDIINEQAEIAAGNKPANPKIISTRKYYPVKNIRINVDLENNSIVLRNDGDSVDVAKWGNDNMYVPELVFSNLLSGTNYDDNEERTVSGMNGLGAKLTNIFSTEFIIELGDAFRGLKYVQRFYNNMSGRDDPVITKYKGAPYTQISFKPDFPRFGLTKLTDDDIVQLMKKRAFDVAALTSKDVNVWYNDNKLDIKTFERYVDLYIGSRGQCKRIYSQINPDWEIAVCASPDNTFEHVSFVNGTCTYRGGKHVDHAANIISTRLSKYAIENKKGMGNLSAKSVKDNMWVFLNTTIVNPSFDAQTKECMTTNCSDFRRRCDVDETFITKLADTKVGILTKAVKLTEFKSGKGLKKSDGKKNKRVKNPKAIPAIYAGDKKRARDCVLILTEGDSAQTTAVAGLAVLSKEQRKYYGTMPLRGKIINPKDAKLESIENNKEFIELKQILGLKQGADYSSSIDTLRYGKIILMTDADVDGDHIKGLGFNLFHEFWPSLLKIDGFFCSMLTPIVKAKKSGIKNVLKFYSLGEFDQWKQQNKAVIDSWEIKYYKGLGTMTSDEAKECFREMKLQKYTWNDLSRMSQKLASITETQPQTQSQPTESDISSQGSIPSCLESFKNYYKQSGKHPCDLAMELAFSKKNADYRKGWITEYLTQRAIGNIDLDLHKITMMSYYDFINEKLIDFSVYDNERSVPHIADGLKPSQRKIVYTMLLKKLKKDMKVSQLSGIVSSVSAYHHGETSLQDTIVGLAQNFPGSNNINLLLPIGEFGTRKGKPNKGIGKDSAAPRYIYTNVNPITKIIFNKTDENIYKYVDDDGQIVEPVFYVPIIPLVLINGARGIGTGWSTDIPSYNPVDVIENVERYLQGLPLNEMQPWYRGFRGSVVKVSHQKYRVTGVYHRNGPVSVEINELPVGSSRDSMSFIDYQNFINDLIIDDSVTDEKLRSKQILSDAEIFISDQTITCTIFFSTQQQLDELLLDLDAFEKRFKLSHFVTSTNMHLFNSDGIMTKYVNPEDILTEYCQLRCRFYEKRKKYLTDMWETELKRINEKIRFITYVCDESHELKVQKRAKTHIIQMLEKYEFIKFPTTREKKGKNKTNENEIDSDDSCVVNYDYLLQMPIYSLTLERIEKLQKEHDNIQMKYDELMVKTTQKLWTDDLIDIKQQMKTFEHEWNNEYAEVLKIQCAVTRLPQHLKKKITVNSRGTTPQTPVINNKIVIKVKS